MHLLFATNNQNKVAEVQALLPPPFTVVTLQQAGIDVDIPEPHPTLHQNAAEKARVIHGLSGMDCFSEDTGLEVEALDGAPGVLSARYAGEEKSDAANIAKLLDGLQHQTNRAAQFRTVMCLLWKGKEYFFEGICKGQIAEVPEGTNGFGYDPVFIPEGAATTFACMTPAEKGAHSHRARALKALVTFLKQELTNPSH